jgi:1,4-dihydroxy-2-naphthoate octaprenyltransferase
MSVWIRAARPATLTAALTPVLVGSATASASGGFRPDVLVAALVGAILIQIGANFANDVFDFQKGADHPGRLGPPRAVATGALTERQMLSAMAAVFLCATACGLYLVGIGGALVVGAGLASIVAALTYVGGPWPYGYRGLGDVACFLFFGAVPIATLDWLHRGAIGPAALLACVPVGALITAILVVNNLRDIDEDRAAGKRTLAVRLGPAGTRREWSLLVAVAYAAVTTGAALGFWSAAAGLLPLLSAPHAWRLRARLGASTGRALNPLLRETARFQLVFGALFAAGLLLR